VLPWDIPSVVNSFSIVNSFADINSRKDRESLANLDWKMAFVC
jgi:hypothetical protein